MTKLEKIGADLKRARVKQAEWTRRVKDLENRYREEENSVIHSMVHTANLTPEQLAQIIELAAKGTVGVYPEQADEPENYSKEDKYIASKPEKCRKQYSDIVANGDEISKHNFTLPETISAKVEKDGVTYTDHLFANADGIARIKLNGWEQAVLIEEQKRKDYVCWLRNPSRQSWSLRMPYEIDGKCRELYPDFLIVRKDPVLKYIVDILEPHNPDFKDNLGKAKGLANYAANEPRIGRVQLIRIGKDAAKNDRFKRLDLAKGTIRNKVLAAINTDELDHIFDTDGVFED